MNADVNPRLLRHQIGILAEVNSAMLTLHRVIGLTSIHPAAIHTDAHASPCR